MIEIFEDKNASSKANARWSWIISRKRACEQKTVLKHQALFHPTIMQYIRRWQKFVISFLVPPTSSKLKLRYSGTWRPAIWRMVTSVSEKYSASIFKIDDKGSTLFRNVGNHLPNYTALYSGRYCCNKLRSNKRKLCLNYVVFSCGGTTFSRAVTCCYTVLHAISSFLQPANKVTPRTV
jgi:hypothetical protein